MRSGRRLLAVCLAWLLLGGIVPWRWPGVGSLTAFASEVNIYVEKIPSGKTGKNLTVSFKVENVSDETLKDLKAGFDVSGGEIWDEDEDAKTYGYSFPFEVTESLPTYEKPKNIGDVHKEKTVSLTGRVRRDLPDGYYKVPVVVMDKDGAWIGQADIQVWIRQSTGTSDDEEDEPNKTYDFVLGEGQSTPDGAYPAVMNFEINLRNNSPATVYNVKASIIPDADSEKFPFEINDVNYDRMFEKIAVDETVPLPYSFAIREDVYSGYYPIAMKIYYSKDSTGEELQTFETSFYVRVHNKEKEDDDQRDFNEHDRTRARIIVDSFSTDPATIIAGEAFSLVLKIRNASDSISATNLLFSMTSEKVSDSAVFTMETGSSSVAVNSLPPGGVTTLTYHLLSRPGVDQRSYGLTFKAKYDSPEFKNAEEDLVVDIPLRQIPRFSTSTFEVMPESITVGSQSNVMFDINNTGKVILYNVTAAFEADSIEPADKYVGNIEPGKPGTVDCMITGAAPTADDGKVKVVISYEDENGETFREEKEMTLYVTEELSEMGDVEAWNQDEEPAEEPGFFQKYQARLLPVSLAACLVLAVLLITLLVKTRRRKAQEDLDEDEEE